MLRDTQQISRRVRSGINSLAAESTLLTPVPLPRGKQPVSGTEAGGGRTGVCHFNESLSPVPIPKRGDHCSTFFVAAGARGEERVRKGEVSLYQTDAEFKS